MDSQNQPRVITPDGAGELRSGDAVSLSPDLVVPQATVVAPSPNTSPSPVVPPQQPAPTEQPPVVATPLPSPVAEPEPDYPDPHEYDEHPFYSETVEDGDAQSVTWTASEFIAHNKSQQWYLAFGVVALIMTVAIYLITRDYIPTGVVVISAVLFGISASRQPRQLQYVVDDHGLAIGAKEYPYQDFRTFTVVDEGPFPSIILLPLKRFAPPLSIYYHPDDEEKIVGVLADHLPMHDHKLDLTESLMRRIRF